VRSEKCCESRSEKQEARSKIGFSRNSQLATRNFPPFLLLFFGIVVGFLLFWGYKTVTTLKPDMQIPYYLTRPEPPCHLVGYEFSNFMTAPVLSNVLDFSLDDSKELFLILADKLYVVGLAAPINIAVELPKTIGNVTLESVTAVTWSPDVSKETFAIYLATSKGVFRWTISELRGELATSSDKSYTISQQFTDGFSENSKIDSLRFWGEKLYIADSGTNQLRIYNQTSGKLIHITDFSSLSQPCGKHLNIEIQTDNKSDSEYTVWISDSDNYRLVPFSPDGKCDESRIWGKQGGKIESFQGKIVPAHFAILSDGSFVISESDYPYIKQFCSDGSFECIVASDNELQMSQTKTPFVVSDKDSIYVYIPLMGKILQYTKNQ